MVEQAGKKTGENLPPLIKNVEFLGTHVIDVREPPSEVTLKSHTILGPTGNDTGILCPITRGVVKVSQFEGYADLHQISIICKSAYITGALPDGVPHQCFRKIKINVGQE